MGVYSFFFFNDTATTEIYTLSLHDALPISPPAVAHHQQRVPEQPQGDLPAAALVRSEEHTSELQSPCNLVCRLLLEKKKKNIIFNGSSTVPQDNKQKSYMSHGSGVAERYPS